MERYLPASLEIPAGLAVLLTETALKTARKNAKTLLRPQRGPRGQTLRPGLDTPLWNELAAEVRARLTRYGDQAKLGRLLGLPRQRMHELLHAQRHLPDAERTLLLLAWLHARRQGLAPA
jgi:hypothetical protein